MNAKQRAIEIYNQHIALAATDGRLFRKTVMDQLMAELGISISSAATHYNTAKKLSPVEGLGRIAASKGVRSPGAKNKTTTQLQDENQCFTVLEIIDNEIGRCQSFLTQGDASECFDEKVEGWPKSNWVMIRGLGPNHGDKFSIDTDEEEIKRYTPKKEE